MNSICMTRLKVFEKRNQIEARIKYTDDKINQLVFECMDWGESGDCAGGMININFYFELLNQFYA
jgi:hypothetical protein